VGWAGWRKDTLSVANIWSVSHSTNKVYSQDQSSTRRHREQFHKNLGDCISLHAFRDYSKSRVKHCQCVIGKFRNVGTNAENVRNIVNIFQKYAQIIDWCHRHDPLTTEQYLNKINCASLFETRLGLSEVHWIFHTKTSLTYFIMAEERSCFSGLSSSFPANRTTDHLHQSHIGQPPPVSKLFPLDQGIRAVMN